MNAHNAVMLDDVGLGEHMPVSARVLNGKSFFPTPVWQQVKGVLGLTGIQVSRPPEVLPDKNIAYLCRHLNKNLAFAFVISPEHFVIRPGEVIAFSEEWLAIAKQYPGIIDRIQELYDESKLINARP